jgi:uncharacterized Zn-finger protein
MVKPFEALRAAKHSVDFALNNSPKCPHCGENYDISRNDAWHLYDDNDIHQVDCPGCEQEFSVTTHCRYTFSTDEQDESKTAEPTDTSTPPARGGDQL